MKSEYEGDRRSVAMIVSLHSARLSTLYYSSAVLLKMTRPAQVQLSQSSSFHPIFPFLLSLLSLCNNPDAMLSIQYSALPSTLDSFAASWKRARSPSYSLDVRLVISPLGHAHKPSLSVPPSILERSASLSTASPSRTYGQRALSPLGHAHKPSPPVPPSILERSVSLSTASPSRTYGQRALFLMPDWHAGAVLVTRW